MNTKVLGSAAELVGSMVVNYSVNTVIKEVAKKVLDTDSMDSKTKVAVIVGTWAISTVVSGVVTESIMTSVKETASFVANTINTTKENLQNLKK